MHVMMERIRLNSRGVVVSSRKLQAVPESDNKGLIVTGPNGHGYAPTNWAFGQLAARAGAPAGYLRDLPAPLAADCINYGLQFTRDIEDIGVLITRDEHEASLRAVNGPNYGRIWNADVIAGMINQFGDGVTGDWRVPGEFGKRVTVTKENTTLYASDRDMFIFLADEDHRIEIPNRRDGEPGTLARGFFCWNSETGASTFGLGTFLFDYACRNRMVWGAEGYQQITIRHTASAPDRYLEEMAPALTAYANSSTKGITALITDARAKRIDDVDAFLASRFTKRQAELIQASHVADEGRPIESLWDAATGITAYARGLEYQDARIDLERAAGKILELAKA